MSDIDGLFKVLLAHQRIPMFDDAGGQRCVGCDNLRGEPDGSNSPRHTEHLAATILASPWLAARDAEVAARALREVADDQESMLLEAMDGDFLLVDCGHIGHEDGRVGLSDVRPTDVSRWARDWLRARADRVAGGEGTA